MEETKQEEKNFRLNIKQNAKGELYYEFTVRADDILTLEERTKQVKELAERTIKND